MAADTIAGLLREQRTRGNHPLLIGDNERISYAEADELSSILARHLIDVGVAKGGCVGVLYPNGPQFVIAFLAATRIGATVVPFSTFMTAPELRWQLRDSAVSVLLVCSDFRGHEYRARLHGALDCPNITDSPVFAAVAPHLRHIVFDADPRNLSVVTTEPVLVARENDVDGGDALAIVYTSGSTGHPKGAIHTHAGLIAHQRSLNAIRGLSADDRLFSNNPFFWIGGLAFGLLATLVAGSTLICSTAVDAAATLDLLEAERPTITNGFAAGISHLARDSSFAARNLTSMTRGNLYPIMAPEHRPADPELRHNMLGLTECGSVVLLSADDTDQPEHRRGSYGTVAPGFEARVLDPESGEDCGPGVVGELFVRGPSLMLRYQGRSREECFDAAGWFHTGDLVRVDADGYYYFVGRAGSMIKTAGANVSPAEVEKALSQITGASAYVLGVPDAERGQLVAAVLAAADPETIDTNDLRDQLRGQLSSYKIPRRYVVLSTVDVPLLSSGKPDLTALRRLFDA